MSHEVASEYMSMRQRKTLVWRGIRVLRHHMRSYYDALHCNTFVKGYGNFNKLEISAYDALRGGECKRTLPIVVV
jgi:hypothetical protein